jgi:hypothetical protein
MAIDDLGPATLEVVLGDPSAAANAVDDFLAHASPGVAPL